MTVFLIFKMKADISLRGYSGWNSWQAVQFLHRIFPKEEAVQPSLVMAYFGGNDAVHRHPSGLGSHVPLPEYVENMKKIYLHLQSLSQKTRLIFLTSPGEQGNESWTLWSNIVPVQYGDGIHPSSEGSKIVAREILKVIKEAEWEPSLYWTLMPTEFDEDSPYYPVLPDDKATFNPSK